MIQFAPSPGMVLMCDFRGLIEPEMTKVRHVAVLSPRRRRQHGTCLVVPFSTVAPNPIESYHHRVPANSYSFFKRDTDVWAKADMITHVSLARLDRVLDGGKYCSPKLQPSDLECIQLAVWDALAKPFPLLLAGSRSVQIAETTVIERVEISLDNLSPKK